jgi:hypothetical protein
MKRKSFILYCDNHEVIKDLTNEEKGQLLDAIFVYSATNVVLDLSPVVKIAFGFIKQALDRDHKKWEEERRLRQESGRRGGLARVSKTKQNLGVLRSAKERLGVLRSAKERLGVLRSAKERLGVLRSAKERLGNQAVNVIVNGTVNEKEINNTYGSPKQKANNKVLPVGSNENYEDLLKPNTPIAHDWQYLALDIIEKLNVPQQKKSAFFRACKENQGRCETALRYAIDFPNPKIRWNMFFVKYNKLKNGINKTGTT